MSSAPRRSREAPAIGPGRFMAGFGGASASDARGAARRLGRYLLPYRTPLAAALLLTAVTSGLSLGGPYLVSQAIDQGIRAHNLSRLAHVLAVLLSVHLANTLCGWVQALLMIRVSQRAVRQIRGELFAHLQRLPLRFFDQRPHGDLMSRLTNDTELVSSTLGEQVTQLFASLLSIVGAAVVMLSLNWHLALASVVTLPVILLTTRALAKATRQGFRDRQAVLGELNGLVEETVAGQRVILVCRHEPQAIAAFEEANQRLRQVALRASLLIGIIGPSMQFMRNCGFAILAGVGGYLVIRGQATVGLVAAFIGYSQQFTRPVLEIANLYGLVQQALAGAERVFEVLDEPADCDAAPTVAALGAVRGEVVFEDVTFGYDPAQPVLREVSFRAAPGQMIALVGHTGAGKTTIINLLTRFYEIDAGLVSIDGRALATIPKADLRRALGIVLQDTFLFADTVRENIRYGRLDATDAEVEQAAELANAAGFIRHLPHGYETPLSEAANNLSQGQRQLLAIARALLADPAVLILDEATSSVDTRTEVQVQEAMLRLMAGRTSFVIAHRLSTIRQADQILVIDAGRIVERGTHAELLAARGAYWRLQA
ncbi:MAG: ABC transporter ATP-binding protein [Fimbriimonadaceae bacterium]|nr:ABC transporter ATP-binding protein [Fimbriimonadaceae bacterium]